jgi:hypothetical protein
MPNFDPGAVEVQQCMLSTDPNAQNNSGQANVSVIGIVDNFVVYEHIMKPYSALRMTLVDNKDILNFNLGLTGNNMIQLSFSQPGQDPYTGQFRITSVESAKSTLNQRTVIFNITGYSPHMNNMPNIQKSYKDITATDAVQDLVNTFIKPIKPILIRASSKGIIGNTRMPYTISGLQIHKAIRGLMLRSMSNADNSSAYMFFENNKNLVIDTLENMVNNLTADDSVSFMRKPLGSDFIQDQVDQNKVILAQREHTRVDSTNDILSTQQATNTFDLFTGQYTQKNLLFSNKSSTPQTGGTPTINNNIGYNILRPPTFAKDYIPARKYMASVFDSQGLTIHVVLNTALTVGQGFAVNSVAPLGPTSDYTPDKISGKLLATELVHSVAIRGDKRVQGTTTVKGVRGPQQDNQST